MVFSVRTALFIFAVQCLAYTVKGFIGFGNPLIAAPLLSMSLDNVLITPGSLMIDIPINSYIAWKNRKRFDWRRIMPVLIAVMIGIVPGAILLHFSLPWILKTVLGLVVVGLGAEMAIRHMQPASPSEPKVWVQLIVAFFSGICSGLFGINLFLVAYLERSAKDYQEFKGSLCFLFLGDNLFRLLTYSIGGLLTTDVLLLSALSVPGAIAGMALSNLLAPRLDEEKLKLGATVLFILGGVSIIVKSLFFHT